MRLSGLQQAIWVDRGSSPGGMALDADQARRTGCSSIGVELELRGPFSSFDQGWAADVAEVANAVAGGHLVLSYPPERLRVGVLRPDGTSTSLVSPHSKPG